MRKKYVDFFQKKQADELSVFVGLVILVVIVLFHYDNRKYCCNNSMIHFFGGIALVVIPIGVLVIINE